MDSQIVPIAPARKEIRKAAPSSEREASRIFVQEGSAVTRDEVVMEADLDVIRGAGLSPIVIAACP